MSYGETWEGGRLHVDSRGRTTYHIRRTVQGKRYSVSTRATTLRGAMEQLKKFEADPEAYLAAMSAGPREGVYLTEELAQEYLDSQPDGKRVSRGWLRKRRVELDFWGDVLQSRDLRRVNLERDILQHCPPGMKNRHRRSVIKALFAWLRVEKRALVAGEGPDLTSLKTIQAKPEQWKREKAVPRENWMKVRQRLWVHRVESGTKHQTVSYPWQHFALAMDVLGATGWHVSELARFIRGGSLETPHSGDSDVAGVLVCPEAKGGGLLRTAVTEKALESARGLLGRRGFSTGKFSAAVAWCCTKEKLTSFGPGQARHTVATWAIEAGADLASVSTFLNHKSPQTTKRFYATHAVPKKVPTLI